jgi:H+/gluconate symporter-like permease
MEIIGYLGLIGSVALLIWMALRGVDIMFAAILSALVVIITNVMPLADSLLTGVRGRPTRGFYLCGKIFLLICCRCDFRPSNGR